MKILAFLLWFLGATHVVTALYGDAAESRRLKRETLQAIIRGNYPAVKAREDALIQEGEYVFPAPLAEGWYILRAVAIAVVFVAIGAFCWTR